MDNEVQYSVVDLVKYAYDEKPLEFEKTFASLVTDKLAAAINDRKIEVAQRMFGDEYAEEGEEEVDGTSEEELEVDEIDSSTQELETNETPEEQEDGQAA